GKVLEDEGLSNTVRAQQDHVLAQLDEGERKELVDRLAVDLAGPGPVEVAHRLDGADFGGAETPFEAPALPLTLLEAEQLGEPRLRGDLLPVSKQAVQAKLCQALLEALQIFSCAHRCAPWSSCRSRTAGATGRHDRGGLGQRGSRRLATCPTGIGTRRRADGPPRRARAHVPRRPRWPPRAPPRLPHPGAWSAVRRRCRCFRRALPWP